MVSDKWGGPERSDGDGSPDRPDEAQEHAGKTQRESQGRAWRDPREWVADEDRSTYFRGHEPMSDEEIAHLHAENAAKGFAYEYRPDDDPDDFADDLTVSDDRRATRDSDEFHLRSADALHKDRTPDSLGKDGASGPGEPDGSQPDGDRPREPDPHDQDGSANVSPVEQADASDVDASRSTGGRHAPRPSDDDAAPDQTTATVDDQGRIRLNDPVRDGPWVAERPDLKEHTIPFGDRVLGRRDRESRTERAIRDAVVSADSWNDVASEYGETFDQFLAGHRRPPTTYAETRTDDLSYVYPQQDHLQSGSAVMGIATLGLMAGISTTG